MRNEQLTMACTCQLYVMYEEVCQLSGLRSTRQRLCKQGCLRILAMLMTLRIRYSLCKELVLAPQGEISLHPQVSAVPWVRFLLMSSTSHLSTASLLSTEPLHCHSFNSLTDFGRGLRMRTRLLYTRWRRHPQTWRRLGTWPFCLSKHLTGTARRRRLTNWFCSTSRFTAKERRRQESILDEFSGQGGWSTGKLCSLSQHQSPCARCREPHASWASTAIYGQKKTLLTGMCCMVISSAYELMQHHPVMNFTWLSATKSLQMRKDTSMHFPHPAVQPPLNRYNLMRKMNLLKKQPHCRCFRSARQSLPPPGLESSRVITGHGTFYKTLPMSLEPILTRSLLTPMSLTAGVVDGDLLMFRSPMTLLTVFWFPPQLHIHPEYCCLRSYCPSMMSKCLWFCGTFHGIRNFHLLCYCTLILPKLRYNKNWRIGDSKKSSRDYQAMFELISLWSSRTSMKTHQRLAMSTWTRHRILFWPSRPILRHCRIYSICSSWNPWSCRERSLPPLAG